MAGCYFMGIDTGTFASKGVIIDADAETPDGVVSLIADHTDDTLNGVIMNRPGIIHPDGVLAAALALFQHGVPDKSGGWIANF